MPNFWRFWEKNEDSYRKYCRHMTNTAVALTELRAFCSEQIGVVYELTRSSSGTSILSGVSQRCSWRNVISRPDKIYPTPLRKGDAWKYSPIVLNLPASLAVPSTGYELGVDVAFTISDRTNNTWRATIDDVVIDESDKTAYLSDVVIGDGSAYARRMNNIPGYDWRVYYGASYKTQWDADPDLPAIRIVKSIGTSAFQEGSYRTSELPSRLAAYVTYENVKPSCAPWGIVITNGKASQANYIPPSDLVYSQSSFWGGVIYTTRGICYY